MRLRAIHLDLISRKAQLLAEIQKLQGELLEVTEQLGELDRYFEQLPTLLPPA